ncbi:hypothetical protein I7I53_09333 [Histoplasma capsulatum var. duboisii H88]|uniref:Uncharacterized protein n=1 Tax=Ajellomyces capsulatus (strain H88) TaxID=544711 RepID=A0A8A1L8S8_AJEC8|nr:hypothetical protein I7I53_09333 [Histoplasma capsulatum var. duboisii H88]
MAIEPICQCIQLEMIVTHYTHLPEWQLQHLNETLFLHLSRRNEHVLHDIPNERSQRTEELFHTVSTVFLGA